MSFQDRNALWAFRITPTFFYYDSEYQNVGKIQPTWSCREVKSKTFIELAVVSLPYRVVYFQR